MPRISVVVVNWNGERFIRKCLTSLLEQKFHSYEVILVDNGSTDSSLLIAEDFSRSVHIIKLDRNYGFARGSNIGARESDGDYVLFMNIDAHAERSYLKRMFETANGRDVMVSSTILKPDGTLESRGLALAIDGSTIMAENGICPSGAAAMYPSAVFEELGGFEERYFSYYEDMDLGLRFLLRGIEHRISDARVWHHHSGISSRTPVYKGRSKRYLLERNRYLFMARFFPPSYITRSATWLMLKEGLLFMDSMISGRIGEYLEARIDALKLLDKFRDDSIDTGKIKEILGRRLVRPSGLGYFFR